MPSSTIDTPTDLEAIAFEQSVVATYRNHADAEAAVSLLSENGTPINHISIVGRNFETQDKVQGFYRPADSAKGGAWAGGLFGMMLGAIGFFILPAAGPLMVIGPLARIIAAGIAGAGSGALINGLVDVGIPKTEAATYQNRLQEGEFLIVVHGNGAVASKAYDILHGTNHVQLETHGASTKGSAADCKVGELM